MGQRHGGGSTSSMEHQHGSPGWVMSADSTRHLFAPRTINAGPHQLEYINNSTWPSPSRSSTPAIVALVEYTVRGSGPVVTKKVSLYSSYTPKKVSAMNPFSALPQRSARAKERGPP